MFRNMLKRSWLSVKRKPGRSIIIGLIFFAMSNLILATLVIRSAVDESMAYAKASLGGTVSLQADMSQLREKNDGGEKPTFTRPSVTKSTADSIASSSYVKDYTYGISTSANADSLTAVESNSQGGPGGMKGHGQSEETSGDFTISGINAYAFINEVENDTMTIQQGDYFDEDSKDSCIISVDLAEANDLSVGSTITFINVYTNETVELKVIGIYDVSSDRFDANTIYMNVDTAAQFISADDYNNGDYNVENVKYELNDAADAEAFIAWINENHPELAENNLKASEDTALYEQMVGPIESVGSFATTTLIVVIIAAVVIVTLIVMINVKDRRYEMGVLLSLGDKKSHIIGQIFCELALVGTIAFVASTLTSTFLAKQMGDGLLQSQITSSQQASENNFGRPSGGPGGSSGGPQNMPTKPDNSSDSSNNSDKPSGTPSAQDDNTITELDISAKPSDFALLFAAGYGIILISLLLPAISILRYQPKQILQGKE